MEVAVSADLGLPPRRRQAIELLPLTFRSLQNACELLAPDTATVHRLEFGAQRSAGLVEGDLLFRRGPQGVERPAPLFVQELEQVHRLDHVERAVADPLRELLNQLESGRRPALDSRNTVTANPKLLRNLVLRKLLRAAEGLGRLAKRHLLVPRVAIVFHGSKVAAQG